MPKVSVVVPVYNVEKYLKRCLNSLIDQTLGDIEIILVDDGSTDTSPSICNEYSQQDKRIKIITKENGGLSSARNAGLANASGLYILFVDSDDYIALNSCETLYNLAVSHDADIVSGNATKIIKNKRIPMNHSHKSLNKVLTGSLFLKEQLKSGSMYMAAWLNLYKKNFILDNDLYFKNGIYHEDEQWTPRVFLLAEKVLLSDISFYVYIIRKNSISTGKKKEKNAKDLINTVFELSQIYDCLEDIELKKLLNDYLVMLYLNAFYIGRLDRKNFIEYINTDFLRERAISTRNILKVNLFSFNIQLYYVFNRFSKIFRV